MHTKMYPRSKNDSCNELMMEHMTRITVTDRIHMSVIYE